MSEELQNVVKNEEKSEEKTFKYIYGVSFKKALQTYFFGSNDETINVYDKVVVETVRGLELGTIKTPMKTQQEVKLETALKPILRKATEEDMANYQKNIDNATTAETAFIGSVKDLNLDMYLTEIQCWGLLQLELHKLTFATLNKISRHP